MCYRTQADFEAAKVAAWWEKRWREGYRWLPSNEFNGFAHPALPVMTSEEPNIIQPMNWGMVPIWAKNETEAKDWMNRTLNARSETIFEKATFRSIEKKRCVISVNGFYEWQERGKAKVKHLVKVKDEDFFGLGGIYETWTNKATGDTWTGFSIITLEANELMKIIHHPKNRMPLIFSDKKAAAEWLVPLSKAEIKERIKQFPSERMYATAV